MHGGTLYSNICFFINDNLKKFWESRWNRGAMVIIPSVPEMFRSQNIENSVFHCEKFS